jgi:hypothetical protein
MTQHSRAQDHCREQQHSHLQGLKFNRMDAAAPINSSSSSKGVAHYRQAALPTASRHQQQQQQ